MSGPSAWITRRDIDFLSDEVLQQQLVHLSGILALLTIAVGIVGGILAHYGFVDEFILCETIYDIGITSWIVLVVLISVAILFVHEFIHGLLFHVCGGRGVHVRYGIHAAMLSAGCPGLILSRTRFCVILAGPAVVISLALAGAAWLSQLPILCYIVFALHLAGCSGDMLALKACLEDAGCTHCEDTECGIRLLAHAA